jgi:hypothetical protein
MPHDVFISHSTAGKLTAYAVCSELESDGIRCWILPRDLQMGTAWDESIANAITGCRIMIVVLPDYANRSDRIERQLEIAFNSGVAVIPFQTGLNSIPSEERPSAPHWLDAVTPEVRLRLITLRDQVRVLIPSQGDGQLPIGEKTARRKEIRQPDVESVTELSQSDLAKDAPVSAAASVGPASGTLDSEKNTLPAFEGLETIGREASARSELPKKVSKWRPIRAFLLILLPFAIICSLGVWQAEEAKKTKPMKPLAGTAAPIGPPMAAKVQHQDKFTASDPGWGAPDANWSVADGKIRVTPLMNSSAILINHAHEFRDAEISAEVVMSKGEDVDQLGGIIFWAKDYNDCYALVISADGKFAVGRKLMGRWINPIAKTGNAAIHTGVGEMNKLRVRTEGTVLTASINDLEVATLAGEPPAGEFSIGLYGESAETTQNVWDFANVTVTSAH